MSLATVLQQLEVAVLLAHAKQGVISGLSSKSDCESGDIHYTHLWYINICIIRCMTQTAIVFIHRYLASKGLGMEVLE